MDQGLKEALFFQATVEVVGHWYEEVMKEQEKVLKVRNKDLPIVLVAEREIQ